MLQLIRKILAPEKLAGIVDIKVSVVGHFAVIKHFSNIEPTELCDLLNDANLGATIQSRTAEEEVEEDLTGQRLTILHLSIVHDSLECTHETQRLPCR